MSDQESRTLWELNPDTFIVPGESQNGAAPLADLEFKRDEDVRGLYRATIDRQAFFTRDRARDSVIKFAQSETASKDPARFST